MLGIQHGFDCTTVVPAVSAGIMQGIDLSGVSNPIARQALQGAINNAVSQGLNTVMGRQPKKEINADNSRLNQEDGSMGRIGIYFFVSARRVKYCLCA